MGNTSRFFSLVSYLSLEQINYVLQRHIDKIYKYAYIDAYRDINLDTNLLKERHVHIVLRTYNTFTVKTIRNWFKFPDNPTNTLGQIVTSETDIVDYLTHCKCPQKGLYSQSEIISNDWEWFLDMPEMSASQCCLEDCINGVGYHDLARRYGREFIINHKNYLELAYLIKNNKKMEFW